MEGESELRLLYQADGSDGYILGENIEFIEHWGEGSIDQSYIFLTRNNIQSKQGEVLLFEVVIDQTKDPVEQPELVVSHGPIFKSSLYNLATSGPFLYLIERNDLANVTAYSFCGLFKKVNPNYAGIKLNYYQSDYCTELDLDFFSPSILSS